MEKRDISSIPVPAARARAGLEPGQSSRAAMEPGRVEPVPGSSPGLDLGFTDDGERSREEESERDTAGKLQHLQRSCPSFHPRVSRWICCWRCVSCPCPGLHGPEPCRGSPSSLRNLSRERNTPQLSFSLSTRVCVPSRSRVPCLPLFLCCTCNK